MTTANKVTIARILLIPVFIVEILYYYKTGQEIHRVAGLLCFAIASVLDGVDGYIARHYNQKSELGAILDPLGDKLLLVSGVVLLSLHSPAHLNFYRIPLWVTATIISRDVILLIGSGVIMMICGKVTVRPRILGKVATVLQMIMVLWILLKWDERWLPYWTLSAAVCTGVSGLLYIYDGMRQLSASPRSLPKAEQ
ncbi:MAG: CDP-diacylglycerol--glycerol-3-phosphate 3-phosphatidyltransferase [Pedosphaera sp.]|nr:CDP-diacylglycerol--glycerol-3-phosphate 3-phosphatidyltransferase [Pedosphaera sp.]